jgi:hypothetical protein
MGTVVQDRRKRIKSNVWVLALVAIAFYAGFIALTYLRGHHL